MTDTPDPERSEGVSERVDARYYGDPDAHRPPHVRPPTKVEQAKARARDDLDRQELANIVYDLPGVDEFLVDGEDEDWRPTTITVGFGDDAGRDTDDVATIMERAGWRFVGATFAPYNRLRFQERGSHE